MMIAALWSASADPIVECDVRGRPFKHYFACGSMVLRSLFYFIFRSQSEK
jgi:hypothetical protein